MTIFRIVGVFFILIGGIFFVKGIKMSGKEIDYRINSVILEGKVTGKGSVRYGGIGSRLAPADVITLHTPEGDTLVESFGCGNKRYTDRECHSIGDLVKVRYLPREKFGRWNNSIRLMLEPTHFDFFCLIPGFISLIFLLIGTVFSLAGRKE